MSLYFLLNAAINFTTYPKNLRIFSAVFLPAALTTGTAAATAAAATGTAGCSIASSRLGV
jgi:hypothetical protein